MAPYRIRRVFFGGLCLIASSLLFLGAHSPGVDESGFRFIRIQYDVVPYARAATWAYDYPTAEYNLHEAIERTTKLNLEGPPLVLRLEDERIFNYPILYLCEPGYWLTNNQEVEQLQRYFARGGFMIIDDFHDYPGMPKREWDNFYYNIKQVFPDREPVRLDPTHQIWSLYFDIDPVSAASTKPYFSANDDVYFGIFDDNGRMMCVICYNQDIGDGWEWPDRNWEQASTVSFQMAINFIMYALSH